MTKTTDFILGISAILLGLVMLYRNTSFASKTISTQKTVDMSGVETLEIHGSRESIRLMTSHQDHLHGDLKGRIKTFASMPSLKFDRIGNRLLVSVEAGLFTSKDLELDLYVTEAFAGHMKLNLSSGVLKVIDPMVVDQVHVNLSSGSMAIQALKAQNTYVAVSSGKLSVTDYSGDFKGHMSSGSINLSYGDFNNDIDFKVASGSLKVNLPQGADFELMAQKSSGIVTSDFTLANKDKSRSHLQGIAGQGGNKITFNLSSGIIRIQEINK